MSARKQSPAKGYRVDPDATTEPVLERLIDIMSDVRSRVVSIEQHLDEQDAKIADVKGAVNLAGSIAARAVELGESNEKTLKKVLQEMVGINELAKSGFHMAAMLRKHEIENNPPEFDPDTDTETKTDSSPEVTIEEPSYNHLRIARASE